MKPVFHQTGFNDIFTEIGSVTGFRFGLRPSCNLIRLIRLVDESVDDFVDAYIGEFVDDYIDESVDDVVDDYIGEFVDEYIDESVDDY